MSLILVHGTDVVAAFPSATAFTNDADRLVIEGIAFWHSNGPIVPHDFGAGVNDGILTDFPPTDYGWDGATLALSAAGIARRNAKAPVPAIVSMAQARIALINAGVFDAVDTVVNNTGTNSATWTWWHYATEVHRNSDLVASLGAAVGLTSDQIDDLFRAAILITP